MYKKREKIYNFFFPKISNLPYNQKYHLTLFESFFFFPPSLVVIYLLLVAHIIIVTILVQLGQAP